MILVVGATGQLGGMVARQLLEQRKDVRILERPQSNYQPLVEAGAQAVVGDLKDRVSLDAAVAGVEIVITTANSAQRGGEDTVETVERRGNRNLIDAAKQAGVKQFIFISALGASLDSPNDFLRAKAEAEQYLRTSGVPHMILEPNIFMEVWIGAIVGMPVQRGMPVTLVGSGQRRHSFVSMTDVAAFTVAVAGNPSAINQTIVIGGPEAVTWREIVQTVGKTIGKDIPTNCVNPGELIPGLPPAFSELMAVTDTYDSPIPMGETAHQYGVKLTSLETYARRTFAGV
jgi:NADH dehydrogenase